MKLQNRVKVLKAEKLILQNQIKPCKILRKEVVLTLIHNKGMKKEKKVMQEAIVQSIFQIDSPFDI